MTLGNHEIMVLQGDQRYINDKYRTVSELLLKMPLYELYGPTTELGRWLRTRNTVLKINNVLFVHGGIHPFAMAKKMTISSINNNIRRGIDLSKEEIRADEDLNFIFRGMGPVWYRGFFEEGKNYHQLTDQHIDVIQSYFDVKKIVVGHTTQESVHYIHGERIIAVDSGMQFGDRGEGALVTKDDVFTTTLDGKAKPIKQDSTKKTKKKNEK